MGDLNFQAFFIGMVSDSKHIDNGVLYQALVGAYNALVENKAYFIGKWQERLGSDNTLVRHKAKQFIGIMADAEVSMSLT